MDTSVLLAQFSMQPEGGSGFYRFFEPKNTIKPRSGSKSAPDENLTSFAAAISGKSLQEDWENEDDAKWESFIKD